MLLAVIAVGTGNDWVRTFGISNRYQDAVKAIGEGYSFLQDVGVVSYEESHYRQSRYMANVAGAAFDAMDDLPAMIGCVCGDDTVLVVMRDEASAQSFCEELSGLCK